GRRHDKNCGTAGSLATDLPLRLRVRPRREIMPEVSELARVPFLAGVPEEELAPWAPEAEAFEVRRREALFCPGDPNTHLILLKEGLIVHCIEAAVGETRMTAIVDP